MIFADVDCLEQNLHRLPKQFPEEEAPMTVLFLRPTRVLYPRPTSIPYPRCTSVPYPRPTSVLHPRPMSVPYTRPTSVLHPRRGLPVLRYQASRDIPVARPL